MGEKPHKKTHKNSLRKYFIWEIREPLHLILSLGVHKQNSIEYIEQRTCVFTQALRDEQDVTKSQFLSEVQLVYSLLNRLLYQG